MQQKTCKQRVTHAPPTTNGVQILSKLYLDINRKLNAIENEICNNAYFYETLSLKINWDLHKLLLRRKKTRSLSSSIKKSCDNRKDT